MSNDKMIFAKEIQGLFQENENDLLTFLQQVQEKLYKNVIDESGVYHLLSEHDPMWTGIYGYYAAVNELEKRGLFAASETLLLDWWDNANKLQREKNERVAKAPIAFKIAEHYWRMGERGTAFRWTLYTYAEDVLQPTPNKTGASATNLRTLFGIQELHLKKLETIAAACYEEAKNNNWNKITGFPEEVIRQLAEDRNMGYLFADGSSIREYPISKAYLQALIDRLDDPTSNYTEKGKALEDLAFYLALLLPGCVPQRNTIDEKQSSEYDVVVHNLSNAGNLMTELLGRHFLIECKNREDAIGVPEVATFLHKMRLAHVHFGIILSKNDISGSDSEKNATELVRKTFHEDGNTCIVINKNELHDLAQGKYSFWWMLVQKHTELSFGKPKSSRSDTNE